MTIRRTARWQQALDDRILEHLSEESWSTPGFIASLPQVYATEAKVRERCRILADVDLVAFLTEDMDLVELTTWGRKYLDGEIDVELYPPPRHPQVLENIAGR